MEPIIISLRLLENGDIRGYGGWVQLDDGTRYQVRWVHPAGEDWNTISYEQLRTAAEAGHRLLVDGEKEEIIDGRDRFVSAWLGNA